MVFLLVVMTTITRVRLAAARKPIGTDRQTDTNK